MIGRRTARTRSRPIFRPKTRTSRTSPSWNLQGGLFKLPYGQVRFALGASYRYNSLDYHPDGQTTEGTSFLEPVNGVYPQGATKGTIKAKEIYGELLVPLLANLPMAHMLNLELGYRYSNYSVSSVGSVPTWKINAEYAPVDWLRFRGGYQRARAGAESRRTLFGDYGNAGQFGGRVTSLAREHGQSDGLRQLFGQSDRP